MKTNKKLPVQILISSISVFAFANSIGVNATEILPMDSDTNTIHKLTAEYLKSGDDKFTAANETKIYNETKIINETVTPMGQEPYYSSQVNSHKSTTGCPFINTLIQRANQDQKLLGPAPTVDELVEAADSYYGIDRGLMKKLANGAADSQGLVVLDNLLNPAIFPVHHGAFAREDTNVDQISKSKRQEFLSRFENQDRISYVELESFQTWCWNSTTMTPKDRLPAVGELALLDRIFGAYVQDNTFPKEMIYNFLYENKLPENFIKSPNPLTVPGLLGIITLNTFRILRG